MAGQVLKQPVFTYMLRDPHSETPLYVGKGIWDRAHKHHFQDSPIGAHLRSMRAAGDKPLISRIAVNGVDEAFELEEILVSAIGRRDDGTGSLFNARPGGRTFAHPEATRKKIGISHVGKPLSEAHKASISLALKGRSQPEDRKQRHSDVMKQWWADRKNQMEVA